MAETYRSPGSLVTTMLPPMSNLETVRTMLACFSAGDPQGQLDRCTDDVVYEAPYYGARTPREGRAGGDAHLGAGSLRLGVVRGRRRLPHRRPRPRDRRGARRQPRTRRRAALPEPLHHVPGLPRRPGLRWREFSNPDVYRTAVRAHDGSARRRRGPRSLHGDRGPDDRHAARRPRRAGHQDRAAGRRPDPQRSRARRSGTAASAARCSTSDDADDRDRLLALATRADVLLESYAPGVDHAPRHRLRHAARDQPAPRLLLDHRVRRRRPARRPPGLRRAGRRAHRPAVGEPRRRRRHHSPASPASQAAFPDLAVPDDCWVAAPAAGPAVRRRAVGEHGLRATSPRSRSAPRCACASRPAAGSASRRRCSRACSPPRSSAWQTVEHADTAELPELDQRPARAEGRVPVRRRPVDPPLGAAPRFVLGVSEGDTLAAHRRRRRRPRDATDAHRPRRRTRCCCSTTTSRSWRSAVAKFPSDEWIALGGRGRRAAPAASARPRRRCSTTRSSPTAASPRSTTPSSARSARSAACTELHGVPDRRARRAAGASAPTPTTVQAEADARAPPQPRRATPATAAAPTSPLDGIRVLDLGLAVAGPWGTMMLGRPRRRRHQGQPAARRLLDEQRTSRWRATAASAASRSTSRTRRRWTILRRAGRDGRRRAAQHALRRRRPPRRRLRDPASRSSPTSSTATPAASSTSERELLPGNDQTGAALAGPDWLDGGLDHGGIPFWPVISLGDTGNGFLSAIAIVQALYHRDRTGEGQFVDTSIIYAQLLNASIAWSRRRRQPPRRPPAARRDAARLARAATASTRRADGWLCVAAVDERTAARARRSAATTSAVDARRPTRHDDALDRARSRVPHARPPTRVVRARSTPPACRARSRRPTSCSTSSTTRR